jgi:lysophospholipase L1-like esterase
LLYFVGKGISIMEMPKTVQKRIWCLYLLLLAAVTLAQLVLAGPVPPAQRSTAKWETEIRAFEAGDRTNPPVKHGILFIGSSSIRLWKTLAKDFPGEPVINRGFGGSRIADSTALADRIIFPYEPRTIVFYAGDNDIAQGHTPEQVAADYQAFVQTVRARLPDTRIAFISIKPSPIRWNLRDRIESANRQIAAMKGDGLIFIDSYNAMLGADGKPRAEMFAADRLHMNATGYRLWTTLVKAQLNL